VTVFEADARVGGHTADVESAGRGLAVDAGYSEPNHLDAPETFCVAPNMGERLVPGRVLRRLEHGPSAHEPRHPRPVDGDPHCSTPAPPPDSTSLSQPRSSWNVWTRAP